MTNFQSQKDQIDTQFTTNIARVCCDRFHCELEDIDELRQAARHMDETDMFYLYAEVLPENDSYEGFFLGLARKLYVTEGLQAMKDELMNLLEEEYYYNE